DVLREWIAANVPNVHPVGRNGMHKYNNQDHSMLTALLSVDNILDDSGHDVWTVNVDEDYHEEQTSTKRSGSGRAGASYGSTGRDAPVLPRRETVDVVAPDEGAA
ncbi:MAG TPA: hypothetical protein VKJ07_02565, partial [Mycobacteriales bacterium]|nr:hypothetical protein [Mycobacteriales bacterium]